MAWKTFTDNRLVKANLNINWQLVKYNTKKRQSASSINIQGLRDPSCRKLYSEAVKKAMENKSSTEEIMPARKMGQHEKYLHASSRSHLRK